MSAYAGRTKMKITQKQLIESLKQLKEIKPRQEWAILLKSQILEEQKITAITVKAKKEIPVPVKQETFLRQGYGREKSVGILDILSSVFFQRKLAYSFALALFLIVGIFGFAQYTVPGDLLFPIKKVAEQSQAALTGQAGLKHDVATLNSRINDLSKVAKEGRTDNIPSTIDEIKIDVSQLAKNLKDNPVQDPQTLKDIVISLKTLADVPGTDLSENPDVKDLYQTVAQSQIADLQNITLTDDQQSMLAEAEDLYNQGEYIDALEKILLINN